MKKTILIIAAFLSGLFIVEAEAAVAFRAASSAGVRTPTISHLAAGVAASAASGNVTPTLVSVESNAFLICLVEQHDNVAISFPAGWTQLYSISTTATHRASAFYKMSAAAEANPLITHAGGNSIIAQCSTFRGVDSSNPLDVAYAAQYAASSASVTSGSLTTLTANDWMLYAMHVANNPTITVAPAGAGGVTWTQRFYSSTALGLRSATGLYTGPKAVVGAVGPITSTLSLASENHGVLMALHNGSRLSIPVPTGTVAGDVMIAAISTTPSTVPITAPAGWTLIQAVTQATATSNRVSTYYRVAGAEPASYFWTLSTTHTGAAGGIVSYSGVDNITPVDVSASAATASALTHTAPTITTTVANDMLVTVHEYASARSWTPPAGMTERVDQPSRAASTAGITLEMNELLLGAAGATGVKTATASASADTGGTVSIALRPATVAPDHIEIDYPAPPYSTCSATPVTVYSCANAACTFYYTGGVNVTLSPGSNMVAIPPGSGSGSGTVLQTTAGAATLSAVSVPGALGATTCKNTSTGIFNCSVTFAAATLTVTAPNLTAGTTAAGTISGCTAQVPVGNNTINFYTAYNNPASGTLNATVNATAIGTTAATSTAIILNFTFLNATTNQASFNLSYPDVGLVNLNACKTLTNCTAPSASGNDPFTAAPHHFTLSNTINCVSGCTVVANPGAANAAGAAFMKAGNPFSMTVTAYNSAGAVTPNFGKETPTAEGVSLSPAMIADPDLTYAGNLTGAFGAFSNGAASGNAFSFDEVGIMTLTAKLAGGNYLASGLKEITTPSSGNIGRFIPDHFVVFIHPVSPVVTQADFLPQTATTVDAVGATAPTTVIPVAATAGFVVGGKVRIPGAGAGGNAFTASIAAINSAAIPPTLTLNTAISTSLAGGDDVVSEWGSYIGEQMNAQFTLSAVELNGSTTNNYQGAYAKFNSVAAGNPLGLGAMDAAGPTYNLALDTSLTATGSFAGGSAAITAPLAVVRGASATGPYASVKIGIAPTDLDGVIMGGTGAYNLGIASAASDHTSIMDPLVQNVTEVRYGRMKISNALGSELLPLPVALTAQYWNGTAYVTNADDNDTVLLVSNVVLGAYQRKAGDTWITSPTLANGTTVLGRWIVNLSKPTATFTGKGSVDLTTNAPSYLPSNTGRATFGVYKGSNDFIYLRENY